MATINGNSVKIYIDGECVAYQKECSLNMSSSTVDVTTKDSDGWTDVEIGTNDWTMDLSGLIEATPGGYKKMKNKWRNKELFDVVYGRPGDFEVGRGLFTSLSESAPLNDRCPFNASIQGVGALAEASEMPGRVEEEEEEDGSSVKTISKKIK